MVGPLLLWSVSCSTVKHRLARPERTAAAIVPIYGLWTTTISISFVFYSVIFRVLYTFTTAVCEQFMNSAVKAATLGSEANNHYV